jgi:predicted DNA-binding transcriptional regulator YafY
MSAVERHLNLVFVLVNSKRPLSREELRTKVGGYSPDASDDAFQRMFERDKDALRENGVHLETLPIDPGFNDSLGYRINPDKFFLPDLKLNAQERVLLADAAKVWTDAHLAKLAEDAADKMGDTHPDAGLGFSLGLSLNHEGAAIIFAAIDDGLIVNFDYLTKGESKVQTRTVEPWQVLLSGGHWYLVGFDHARQEQRTFKLARFKSEVSVTKSPITQFKPDDFDIMRVVSYWRQTQDGDGLATLHVLHNQAGTLRLQAESVTSKESFDELTIRYANEELLALDIASVVDKVVRIEPASLRQEVTRIIAGTHKRHVS